MRKLFVKEVEGDIITIDGDEHKHLSIVLRAKKDDDVLVCDQMGKNYQCKIADINKSKTTLKVQECRDAVAEPTLDCHLFFGVLKGSNNDSTVRHAVELGVNRLIPFLSTYTVKQDIRAERLNKIALEASKQCGRSRVPFVENPIDFSAILGRIKDFDFVVFMYENATLHIKDFLKNAFMEGKNNKKVAVIVGAEGGFCQNEADELINLGVVPLSMGARILKADTASVTALSCVMYESENL